MFNLTLDATIINTIVTGILLAIFYFFGRMLNTGMGSKFTKEDCTITGLHFFLLYIAIPLAFFLADFPIPISISNFISFINKIVSSHLIMFVLLQFLVMILIEQILYHDRLKKGIFGIIYPLQKSGLLKYAIILFVIPFEYPTFILGLHLKEASNLSNLVLPFLSIIIVFLSLAYLAIFVGKIQKLDDLQEEYLHEE